MFKSILFLLLSVSLFANSNVGDNANYSLSSPDGDGTLDVTVSDFDSNTDTYKLTTVVTFDGKTETSTDDFPFVWTRDLGSAIVDNCDQFNGAVVEQILIDGTNHDTCKISLDAPIAKMYAKFIFNESGAGNIWLGDFPVLGIAKMEMDETTLDLTTFNWN